MPPPSMSPTMNTSSIGREIPRRRAPSTRPGSPIRGAAPLGGLCLRAPSLVDRDVLDLRLPASAVEALEVPVDQRPQGEEELAHERRQLIGELAWDERPQALEGDQQGGEVGQRRPPAHAAPDVLPETLVADPGRLRRAAQRVSHLATRGAAVLRMAALGVRSRRGTARYSLGPRAPATVSDRRARVRRRTSRQSGRSAGARAPSPAAALASALPAARAASVRSFHRRSPSRPRARS